MTDGPIEPATVTRPFQMLAAWLAGLIAVDGAFLAAAAAIHAPLWVPAMLAVAAVANVPIFLACVFLLQTCRFSKFCHLFSLNAVTLG